MRSLKLACTQMLVHACAGSPLDEKGASRNFLMLLRVEEEVAVMCHCLGLPSVEFIPNHLGQQPHLVSNQKLRDTSFHATVAGLA